MKEAKFLIALIAVVLGLFLAFAAIGMIVTAVKYLFWLGVILLAGTVAVKLLKKFSAPQLETKSAPANELETVRRALDEYKRRELTK